MKEQRKSAYEQILLYRDELELPTTIDIDYAVNELLFSHKWLNFQVVHIINYMKQLQELGIVEPYQEGNLDIFELFKGIDKLIFQRESMLRVIKNFKLENEYTRELENLLGE